MILNAIKQMERASRNNAAVVSLAQGIPFQTPNSAIHRAAIRAIAVGLVDQYSDPQGLLELRETIAAQLRVQHMTHRPPEIIVTAGAIEALNSVLHTLVTPERNQIVMPVPVYSAYGRAVQLAGGVVVPVHLQEHQAWKLDVSSVRASITPQTAAILICNPNNPTGTVYDQPALQELAEIAIQNDCVLVTDEVYGNMLYDDTKFYTPASDPLYKKHCIRIVSFSKDFGLTGWRIGYLQAHHSRIASLLAVHDTFVNCAPVVSQYAAVAAIEHSSQILAANQLVYVQQRAIVLDYLQQVGDFVQYTVPTGAYFFFVRIKDVADTTAFCLDLLRDKQVALVPGADFGPGGEGHVRICFGRSTEAIHTGMQRFVAYIKEQHGA